LPCFEFFLIHSLFLFLVLIFLPSELAILYFSFTHSSPFTFLFVFFVLFAACKRNGIALKYGSPRVQDSVDLAPVAVVQNWKSLEYCSPRLRADPETVINL